MWEFRERDQGGDFAEDAVIFAVGAAGGFALGMLLSGRARPQVAEWGRGIGDRARGLGDRARGIGDRARTAATTARGIASRLKPARLRREPTERSALTQLEDAVLDAFLADGVLSERGIDVGAISQGIVELSGSVWTEEEADLAVSMARSVAGVDTVVNRLDVEESPSMRGAVDGGGAWEGRKVGMGRRRQGVETDPARNDDSQHSLERAMARADRKQYVDEGWAARPRQGARGEGEDAINRTNYDEDELDNQSPYGKHAVPVPEQPQAMNSDSRVGEGTEPGTELRLEAADLPVKPHGKPKRHDQE